MNGYLGEILSKIHCVHEKSAVYASAAFPLIDSKHILTLMQIMRDAQIMSATMRIILLLINNPYHLIEGGIEMETFERRLRRE